MSARTVIVLMGAATILGLAAVAAVLALGAVAGKSGGLVPANLSALGSNETRLSHLPDVAAVLGGENMPAPGEVHRLGHGALAWEKSGRICTIADHTGGCVDHWPHPIDATIGDVDALGSGEPARVLGLATDDVETVIVRLADGRSITGSPQANAYFIPLPDDTRPWDVVEVEAILKSGDSDVQEFDIRPPGGG